MKRAIVAGVFALIGSGAAQAGTLLNGLGTATADFETSDMVSAGYGSFSTGSASVVGGICAPSAQDAAFCPQVTTTGTLAGGGAAIGGASGYFSVTTPTAPANYELILTLADKAVPNGSIFDVTITTNPLRATGWTSLGTTSVVKADGTVASAGIISASGLAGNTTYDISITDLLEQFIGSSNNLLPGILNPGLAADDGGVVSAFDFANGLVSVTAELINIPEPASLGVFACGIAGLVGMRLRNARV